MQKGLPIYNCIVFYDYLVCYICIRFTIYSCIILIYYQNELDIYKINTWGHLLFKQAELL